LTFLPKQLKSIALKHVKDFAPFLSPEDLKSKILPAMKACSTNKQVFVRISVAESLLSLCSLIGRPATEEQVLPIFSSILKDDHHEVQMALFHNLGSLSSVIPLDNLSASILPVFQELASDRNWRMRLQAMETFYMLAVYMTESFMKQSVSIKFLTEWLGDKYFAVREGAVNLIYRLSQNLGGPFLEKTIIPLLLSFQSNHNYLYRLTLLFGLIVKPHSFLIAVYFLPKHRKWQS
jgi:hypothetical protein